MCFATNVCVADDYKPCVIETMDGDTIECIAQINNYFKAIIYKTHPGAKKQKLAGKKVRFATFCEGDSCTIFSGIPIVQTDDAVKGKTKGKFGGFHRFLTNPKEGKFAISRQLFSNGTYASDAFFFYRPGEDYCTWAYYPFKWGYSSDAKKAIQLYMSDCPEIIEYISKKDFKIGYYEDFIAIVVEYMNCGNK